MILWRPVGLDEMALVYESEMKAFPPRLPEQPIFYPVLNDAYADQIARDWNAKQTPFAGYVLEFEVPDAIASQYASKTVGATAHKELWVPAEELPALNASLVRPVTVVRAFFGAAFRGAAPTQFGLRGADAVQQIQKLIGTMSYSMFDFSMEISANHLVVFLHFPFWAAASPSTLGVHQDARAECLRRIQARWEAAPRFAPLLQSATIVG
ncbi:MAG TPA: hypothetical protein VHB79_17015 [Polyangiaceae bacterium]|nr:hypothetical protein [Polyangiaceae bacterium]